MPQFKIIISGVSSFSGAHFAFQMLEEGHEVFGFTRKASGWSAEQEKRISWVQKEFPKFQIIDPVQINTIPVQEISAISLHGGVTTDYKSKTFNIETAVKNTLEINEFLINHCKNAAIMQTGTFSEPNESAGEFPRASFNPYSMSKTLIWEELKKKYAGERKLAKYVMPNPFGPLEAKRFTDYLLKTWAQKLVPEISFPFHVRDNVPIDLLRKHFTVSMSSFLMQETDRIFYPSKYPESILAFAERYSREIFKRTNIQYHLAFQQNSRYVEPIVRVNSEPCEWTVENWIETISWDRIVVDALERIHTYSV